MGRARDNGVLDYLPPDPEGGFVEWISTVGIGISVVAGIISYSRHRSVPWAIAHGWAGAPYLVYLGYKAVVGRTPAEPAALPADVALQLPE